MQDRSETRYAKSGNIHIAYQVMGTGPMNIVLTEGFVSHLDVAWEFPPYRKFCQQLASFARVIRFDKRGMGLSDHVTIGTLEERMDDIRAVLDAVEIPEAVLLGESEGGPLSLLFSATYPERTRALILCGAEVKERKTDDWPWGECTTEEFEVLMASLSTRWGQPGGTTLAPSLADQGLKEHFGRICAQSCGPGTAEAVLRLAFDVDVRHVLPSIHVPTLILHRVGDKICDVHNARYLAEHIGGARYIELPGEDHLLWGEDIVSEIQEFLTGVREPEQPDRVLSTILFTDVVGSTELADRLGDVRWHHLLENHHNIVRKQLEVFRGREVDTAGDGFFAAFDGPARAIRCAMAIGRALLQELGLNVRAGVHTGECEVIGDKLGGIAVHIGARVAALAGPGEVLVSQTVRDLVAGSRIEFDERGKHQLKGIPGQWDLFSVVD